MNKFNAYKTLILVAVLGIALATTMAHAESRKPNPERTIALNCDGYSVDLQNTGIIQGTISFEEGKWTEVYINGVTRQPDEVLLLNVSTLRLAVLGPTYISGVRVLALHIYRNQTDYNLGYAQHDLRCRRQVNGE